ncbi:MAG: IS1595 family transposase [Alphaproteobacteria bacterium]
MAKPLTVQDFFKRFPTDDACLDHLMETRYGRSLECPKCKRDSKFYRLRKELAYTCEWCGHHIHPMVGTPFERSRTPLQKWFYAMYMFTTTRHGVSAKELQRQLGVTYKTAWRMGHEIRKYMGDVDGDSPLSGHVEADETYIGGKKAGDRGHGARGKTIVFGMVERNGDAMTHVVQNAGKEALMPLIIHNVLPGTRISTDEFGSYMHLAKHGYEHGTVNHGKGQYARGLTHTNTIEGLWSILKRSIRGTHIHVSPKHLPKYLGEFEFRFNLRKSPDVMFGRLLASF